MTRRRSRQRAEIWLGLLVLVSTALLIWGYFWLTGQPLGQRGYRTVVVLPDAEGLSDGDLVLLSGVDVGHVSDVRLLRPGRVAVSLFLRRGIVVPRDSRAILQSVGVLGDKVIELRAGTSDVALAEGDTLGVGQASSLFDLASTLGSEAESVLTQLDKLLADTTIERAHGSMAALEGALRELERLIRTNSDEFAAMSQSLRNTARSLEGALEGVEIDSTLAQIEVTAARLSETAESLQGSAESLSSVIRKIDEGQGTLGLLVNDPGLYEDLRSAARSAASLTQDIQQNPGRYLKLAIF